MNEPRSRDYPVGGITVTPDPPQPLGQGWQADPSVQPQATPALPPELLAWGAGVRTDLAAIRALLEKLVADDAEITP